MKSVKAKLTAEDHTGLGIAFCISLWISEKQLHAGKLSDWMFILNVMCGVVLCGIGIYIIRSLFTEMKDKDWNVGVTWSIFVLVALMIESYFIF